MEQVVYPGAPPRLFAYEISVLRYDVEIRHIKSGVRESHSEQRIAIIGEFSLLVQVVIREHDRRILNGRADFSAVAAGNVNYEIYTPARGHIFPCACVFQHVHVHIALELERSVRIELNIRNRAIDRTA